MSLERIFCGKKSFAEDTDARIPQQTMYWLAPSSLSATVAGIGYACGNIIVCAAATVTTTILCIYAIRTYLKEHKS